MPVEAASKLELLVASMALFESAEEGSDTFVRTTTASSTAELTTAAVAWLRALPVTHRVEIAGSIE